MVPIIGYILPAMQIVCHLVPLGNVTNSIPAIDQSPPQNQLRPLPDGYVAYPEIGVAWKFFNQSVTPVEARHLCGQEGAQLAVIDSSKKVEYMKRYISRTNYVNTGIIRIGNAWTNLNTGLSVSSIPWQSGQPSRNGDCLLLALSSQGVSDWNCQVEKHPYACEFPIHATNYLIAAN